MPPSWLVSKPHRSCSKRRKGRDPAGSATSAFILAPTLSATCPLADQTKELDPPLESPRAVSSAQPEPVPTPRVHRPAPLSKSSWKRDTGLTTCPTGQ